jgi:hypothetical protein
MTCDWLGEFDAGAGRYVLDVELSKDGSAFNSRDPHLAVFEVGGVQESAEDDGFYAFWGGLVLTTLGTAASFSSLILSRREKLDSLLRAWPLTIRAWQLPPPTGTAARLKAIVTRRPFRADYLLGDRRSLRRWPLTGLSSFALILAIVSLSAFVGRWIFEVDWVPKGLVVHLLRPESMRQRSPGIEPLLVQVKLAPHTGPSLYVDYQPIPWGNFATVLQKELNRRPPNWPVYFEGDPDMEWRWAGRAIDEIRGLRAAVILLTPGSYREQSVQAPIPVRAAQ